MTIRKKARLLAHPFKGSIIDITVGDQRLFGINQIHRANGHTSMTVDWGDGTVETIPDPSVENIEHEYATAGNYEVKVSDDVALLTVIGAPESVEKATLYAPLVTGFRCNAEALTFLGPLTFVGCDNLRTVDVRRSEIQRLVVPFIDCTSLSGELYFPKVSQLIANAGRSFTFQGCTGGITKIHFPAASAETIGTCKMFTNDPTLGTGTAEVVFDL